MARVLPAEAAIDKEFDYLFPGDTGSGGAAAVATGQADGTVQKSTVQKMGTPVRVGTMVRVDLGGRRVAGWVVDIRETGGSTSPTDPVPAAGDGLASHSKSGQSSSGQSRPGQARSGEGPVRPDRALRPLALVSGWGPEPEVVDLAGWAAWRWAGRRANLLSTASPERRVPALPAPARRPPAVPAAELIPDELRAALAKPWTPADKPWTPGDGGEGNDRGDGGGGAGRATSASLGAPDETEDGAGRDDGPGWPWVLRLPPSADPTAVVAWLAQRGPTLVVVPALDRAAVLAGRLRRAGADVAVLPGEWAQARAGAAVVIGARAAAWGPCPGLAAVVVIDGHDPSLVQEQAPTWSAVDVAAERARRAGAACVVISACPPAELLAGARLLRVAPDVERAGWSVIDVVDRRPDDPRRGLYSRAVVEAVRSAGVVLCVLNRVGRARLLACAACGTIADCERCGAAVASLQPDELCCPRCGMTRPVVCRSCTSTRLRQLRVGVSRAREELEALAGRPVGEVTGVGEVGGDADVVVGTEAVLHRRARADVVAFLDFDQHLLGARLRAPEEALALLARASRLTGGRRARTGRGPGRVLVQTRLPDHPVLVAAGVADPGRLVDHELAIRRQLRLPPVTAVAAVSGPGAPDLVAGVEARAEPVIPLEVLGPDEGRWLLRARDHEALADALAGLARPAERVRIDVDPQRL